MTNSRPALFLARCLLAVFFLLTSAYCLLAYIPFTYQQLHVGQLLPWLVTFARIHAYLYCLAVALTAFTLIADVKEKRTRLAALVFLALLFVAGVGLLIHPALVAVPPDFRSILWAMAALAPLLGMAAIDWLGHHSSLRWLRSEEYVGYIFTAAWKSALYLALLYLGITRVRNLLEKNFDASVRTWLVAAGWSLISHLTLFMLLFIVMYLLSSSAALFRHTAKADSIGFSLVAVLLLWLYITRVVFPPISFTGPLAAMVGLGYAVAMVAFGAGTVLRLYRADEGPVDGGLDLLLSPLRFMKSFAWWSLLLFLAALSVAAGYLAARTAHFDWNYLIQEGMALAVWTLAFGAFYMFARARATRRSQWVAFALATVVVTAYLALLAIRPQVQTDSAEGGVAARLDDYAGYDVSFRMVHEALSKRDLPGGGDPFYGFLAENTNIPHSVRVEPVNIDFVPGLTATPQKKPNIFIFVIDSLRRDYVSPYNSAVTFTPSIAAFAAESVVMDNAFTRYGGTAMSEPSIWLGGMMLHKQYISPFYPMNSLEKLIVAEHYRTFITRDPILGAITSSASTTDDLDQDVGPMHYDLCHTLTELTTKLGQTDTRYPIFVYTQPQNIHVSVIEREGRSVISGENYDGFDPPYASRVRRIDACFGDFIRFLKKNRLYDDSIIVLTADHGDSLGEKGRWGHAYSLFAEVIRVPLIIHLPADRRAGYTTDRSQVAFLTDITPSLYTLLGHPPAAQDPILGRSLFTAPGGPPQPRSEGPELVVSSYGAVYGILSDSGRTLYIADGVAYRDYLYELDPTLGASAKTITDTERSHYQQLIRNDVQAISRFYHYRQ